MATKIAASAASTVRLEDDPGHVVEALSRREHLARGDRVAEEPGMGEEADANVRVEDLLDARRQRADVKPRRRDERDEGVGFALHAEQHDAAQRQRDRRQHLIGYAEQRP